MWRRGLIVGIAALAVGGCYPYRLTGDDVVPTDARLAATGYRLPPGQTLADTGERLGLTVTEERLPAAFGDIALTRFEHAQPRPLIVFCGGNMFRREVSGARTVELLAPHGDVWILDYPGYGDTPGAGRPDEFAQLAEAVADRVDRAVAGGRPAGVVFWGHSLGGLVCGDIAGRTEAQSDLVLMATFQSFDQVVRAGATALVGPLGGLVRPVIGDDVPAVDLAEALAGYEGAAIVVASRDDDVVPFLASARLEAALRRQGLSTRLVAIPSGDHSRIHEVPGLVTRVVETLEGVQP